MVSGRRRKRSRRVTTRRYKQIGGLILSPLIRGTHKKRRRGRRRRR
jgi:hypothetical protein